MLRAVASVRDELLKRCPKPHFGLELITAVFFGLKTIDKHIFVRYDTPPENPIWGEFTRWNQQPGVYAPFETVVEIRYAAHLLRAEDWLRFIICKELCHSLEAPDGGHDVSSRTMERVVDTFSLLSAQRKLGEVCPTFNLEMLAEVGALELLCPLSVRKQIVAEKGQPDEKALVEIAAEYHLPVGYVTVGFLPEIMKTIEGLLQ